MESDLLAYRFRLSSIVKDKTNKEKRWIKIECKNFLSPKISYILEYFHLLMQTFKIMFFNFDDQQVV